MRAPIIASRILATGREDGDDGRRVRPGSPAPPAGKRRGRLGERRQAGWQRCTLPDLGKLGCHSDRRWTASWPRQPGQVGQLALSTEVLSLQGSVPGNGSELATWPPTRWGQGPSEIRPKRRTFFRVYLGNWPPPNVAALFTMKEECVSFHYI